MEIHSIGQSLDKEDRCHRIQHSGRIHFEYFWLLRFEITESQSPKVGDNH
jgi:hypothetical protein